MTTASSASSMGSVSPGLVGDRGEWIKQHMVGWRLGPYREFVKEHGVVQTGYELVLSGRFVPAREDLTAFARSVQENLRAIALEALGPATPDVFLFVLPSNHWILPAEERFTIEVELLVIASLAHPDQPPAPVETRQRIGAVEARLRAMGLHKR